MELNLRVLDKIDRDTRRKMEGLLSEAEINNGIQLMRDQFKGYWDNGDIEGALMCIGNSGMMALVCDNYHLLRELGLFEEALIEAYISAKSNFSKWDPMLIRFLFDMADPPKLRTAGDPMPEHVRYILFRGVAGRGSARRVNGMSWTDSSETAVWFANRFGLDNPAVFTVTVGQEQVLAYLSGRNESEYLLKLPLPMKPKRIK